MQTNTIIVLYIDKLRELYKSNEIYWAKEWTKKVKRKKKIFVLGVKMFNQRCLGISILLWECIHVELAIVLQIVRWNWNVKTIQKKKNEKTISIQFTGPISTVFKSIYNKNKNIKFNNHRNGIFTSRRLKFSFFWFHLVFIYISSNPAQCLRMLSLSLGTSHRSQLHTGFAILRQE